MGNLEQRANERTKPSRLATIVGASVLSAAVALMTSCYNPRKDAGQLTKTQQAGQLETKTQYAQLKLEEDIYNALKKATSTINPSDFVALKGDDNSDVYCSREIAPFLNMIYSGSAHMTGEEAQRMADSQGLFIKLNKTPSKGDISIETCYLDHPDLGTVVLVINKKSGLTEVLIGRENGKKEYAHYSQKEGTTTRTVGDSTLIVPAEEIQRYVDFAGNLTRFFADNK